MKFANTMIGSYSSDRGLKLWGYEYNIIPLVYLDVKPDMVRLLDVHVDITAVHVEIISNQQGGEELRPRHARPIWKILCFNSPTHYLVYASTHLHFLSPQGPPVTDPHPALHGKTLSLLRDLICRLLWNKD